MAEKSTSVLLKIKKMQFQREMNMPHLFRLFIEWQNENITKSQEGEAEMIQSTIPGVGIRVAALFVQPDGVYSAMPDVDLWPESRDARTYAGELPVVAHPPCQRWGRLGAANYARWGGEHNRPGNDRGCFASALASVRKWGGVLEHPAHSHAWPTFFLTPPPDRGWLHCGAGEYVCEVWQSAYGHKAAKATWLFYCGPAPADACWDRIPGTHQVGFPDQRGKAANKPTLSKHEANATPPAFARWLVELAASSRVRVEA